MTQGARVDPEIARLWRTAETLARRSPWARPARRFAPSLILITDPDRTPDPVALAERLPRGCAVIHRTFGRQASEAQAFALAACARRRGLILLIGADDVLAARVGAHGVHLPERDLARARALRRRRPGWIITGAAHGARALGRAAAVGLDAVLVSPVFESRSPSAGATLGPLRFALLILGAQTPVYALGGVNALTASRLGSTGVVGVAAVEGLTGNRGKPTGSGRA